MAHDQHFELGHVARGFGDHRQPGAGLDRHARAQRAGQPRPSAAVGLGHDLLPELEPQAGVGGHGDRRAGRHLRRVDDERDAAVLAGVQAHRRLLEADRAGQRRVGAELGGDGSPDGPASASGSGSTRAGASAGVPPRSKPAVPGASKALRSASLSARSPTWSRAVTARPARTRCAPARRSSAATIGRSTRSIAADKALHERMVLVESAAVDLDDHLRARRVERGALQLLERVADHLAVELRVPGSPSWPASVVSCAARPDRITSPPSRVARDGLSGIG